MSMMDWAKREVEIACANEREDKDNGEWDYGCACYESALKAFESLMDDGHSGFSISMTKQILNRLIECKPLTPIEDNDDVWNDVTYVRNDGTVYYQCKRMSSLFKNVYKDGTVKYSDTDRITCVNVESDSYYYNGFIASMIDEMYPIQMPYYPRGPIKVYCSELLTDRKNGDFDTIAILYILLPSGEKVNIERFFKESDNSFEEISKDEYNERMRMHLEREKKEKEND